MRQSSHTNIPLGLLLFTLLLFCSCSKSPEEVGEEYAEEINKNREQYIIDRNNAEHDFLDNFNSAKYFSRDEAYMEFDSIRIKASYNFFDRQKEIVEKFSKISGKYLKEKNLDNYDAFNAAYENALDQNLISRLESFKDEADYPPAVLSAIRTIIPIKPSVEKIKEDLLEVEIAEGFPKEVCWFNESVRWTIAKYDIENFKIEEVLKDTDKEYIFIATMRLENDHNAFDARLKISYQLPGVEDWKMEFVNSKGVSVVNTHKYDDLVSYEIAEDDWGGVNCLYITNKSNVELGVGVDYVANNIRRRSTVVVSPGKKVHLGGAFGGGNVTSYEIGFVVRY